MPYITGTLQPAEVGYLRCPRCWFSGPFIPLASLVLRCTRCEWPFTVAAATPPSPSVPATTVPVTNNSGSVMAVTITAGTLTFVFVNGVQAGTAAGLYLVPVAGTISITYSVAPGWTWALPVTSASTVAGGTALTFAPLGTNVAFSNGQVLVVDAAGTSDIVTVTGTPTATSVPVTALAQAHASGKTVSVLQLTPQLSGVGENQVPLNAY